MKHLQISWRGIFAAKINYLIGFNSPNGLLKKWNFIFFMFFMPILCFGQTLTISSSGETGTSGTTWSISGTTLTVTGTADVNSSVIESALANGDLYIEAGNINVNANITSTTANVLRMRTSGYIEFDDNTTLSTSGGSVILWSSSSGGNAGYIRPSNITTNGGHVWIGGSGLASGERTWNGLTVGAGYAMALSQIGVGLLGNISTNGGDVMIAGESGVSNASDIEATHVNRTIATGSGDIILMPYSEQWEFIL